MHNIKEIRNNTELFKDRLKKRFLDVDIEIISNLDEQNRKLIQEKENLEKEKKDISKSKDSKLFDKSKEISVKIEKLSENQQEVKFKLDTILSTIPNLPLDDVPIGKDEKSNKEIEKKGNML